MSDIFFMTEALKEARAAFNANETPIGAVIVLNGVIIAKGHNMRNSTKNPLAHAELIAINSAARVLGDWRLEDTEIYVTLEPCPMCAGAIIQARISRLIYGAANKKAGCCRSVFNMFELPGFNHTVQVQGGIMEEESGELMSRFFEKLRQANS